MNIYTLPLDDQRSDVKTVGGKGASLARLARAGLPVPTGFHVSTQAYCRFVEANHLQPKIMRVIRNLKPDQTALLDKASTEIHELFMKSALPDDISQPIIETYRETFSGESAVAVRSSATAEDLPDASFAGQQETYLNVSGAQAVLEAVRNCWASLWTARAIAYRLKNKIDSEAITLAVIVQELVPAEVAGILFTANPLNGKTDEVMINAAWGLGEAVVGGLVSPDCITVAKANGKIKRYEIADKTVMTVCTINGTREQVVPRGRRKKRVLSAAQAAELTGLAICIEQFYGCAQDIEWCQLGNRFFILQARPITTIIGGEAFGWTLPDPKANYMRSSLAEHIPNAVSPLFATLGLREINASTRELAEKMNMDLSGARYQYQTLNGYVYMSYQLNASFTWEMIKVTLAGLKVMYGQAMERWQAARQDFAEEIATWETKDILRLTPVEIVEGVRALMYAAGKYYTVIQSGTLPSASTSEMIFTRVYKWLKRENEPAASALLLGTDSAALRAEKSLFDIAGWVRKIPELTQYVIRTPSLTIATGLRENKIPRGIADQDWERFTESIEGYLRDFGATSFELDFMNPAPIEIPEIVIEVLKNHLYGKGSDPYQREREASERREKVSQAIHGRFHLIPRRWFDRSLKWALECNQAREDSLADMGMGHATIRKLLQELGRRFAASGAIGQAEDIYWLLEEEVERLAAALESRQPLENLAEKARQRKVEWKNQMKLLPPAILPDTSIFAKMIPWARGNVVANVLKGLAASPGSISGTARVLFGPEDFGRMKSGDILVAVTTTPAWTPLFALAGGIVTDIGGPLSHSSIVAREYGIPAVLATGIATRRIHDGQIVVVDGSAGTVILQ